MEDIHLFLLKLKQQIEIEYYKLQLEYSDYTKLNIIDIINEYEQGESSIIALMGHAQRAWQLGVEGIEDT